ncbi:MAG TPA: hypothetical protein PK431_15710 [Chitinophagales bacterium]|nr:hypothetical protein [Chitinophagales bacterium]
MKKAILFLSVFAAFCSKAIAQNECSAAFCDERKQQVGTVCHQHKEGGALVYYFNPDGSFCFCRCSCIGSYTPVALDNSKWMPIGEVKVGDKVLALQKDNKWISSNVVFSDGTEGSNRTIPYAIFISLTNGTKLVTTPDHIFLMPDKSLKRADRLSPIDNLTDEKMQPVKITQIVAGEYAGNVHNIAVGKWDSQNPNVEGHFINTKGIISGDFYVQSIAKGSQDIGINLPQVGSIEYTTMYKSNLKEEKMLGISSLEDEIKMNDNATFKPIKPVLIPKDAINFLPKEYEEALKGTLAPLDNSIPYEVANYIVYNYKRFFPDVVYHVDWSDNVVNAYAWMEGNTRHVALKGGLIRHNAIKVEGVGLVLAHELGHHYGGAPRYPGNPWASCEGQADYWGAMVAERIVWWGPYALDQIEKGSQQLYNLFCCGLKAGDVLSLTATKENVAGICSHPPALCRLQTYRAGLRLETKPACAGDPPSVK